MTQKIIYLVRHGQQDKPLPDSNGYGGWLTPLGRRQAKLTGKRLAQLPIDAIHYSTLHRAAETAAIISDYLPNVPMTPSKLLWECLPPVSPQARRKFFSHLSDAYIKKDNKQAQRAFEKFFKPVRGSKVRREVIVCHGNIIRYFMTCVLRVAPQVWHHADIRNCGITEVVLEPEPKLRGHIMLASHGDVGHLPPTMWTYA